MQQIGPSGEVNIGVSENRRCAIAAGLRVIMLISSPAVAQIECATGAQARPEINEPSVLDSSQ
jgi:hypothetical protein